MMGLSGLLVGGGLIGLVLLVALSIIATAGPVILVIWVIYKLFF